GACFYLAPSENIGVIALANRPGFIGLLHEIFDMLFNLPDSVPRQPVAAPDRGAWRRFVGSYLGHLTGLVTISFVSYRLVLARNGKEFTLRQMGKNEFVGEAADSEHIAIGFPGPESGEALYVIVDDGPCQRVATPQIIPPDPSL